MQYEQKKSDFSHLKNQKATIFIACEQALLFGRAKRAARERTRGRLACLSRVYFSRYPPNGELAHRLQFSICKKLFQSLKMRKFGQQNGEENFFSPMARSIRRESQCLSIQHRSFKYPIIERAPHGRYLIT